MLLVHDQELDRLAALKLLQGSDAIASPERFRDEAQALSRLTHPNIVELYDYGIADQGAYLVLEYVGGGSLSQAVVDGPLPPRKAAQIGAAVLDALEYSHKFGILHRDLKPENVLLGTDGSPKLADFGLAKYSGSSARTATGLVVGTVEFMAPELFQGVAPTATGDLYSWGCLLYYLAQGELPYSGTLQEVVQASAALALPGASKSGPFSLLWRRVLTPDPEKRANPAEIRRLLARCVEGIEGPVAAQTRILSTKTAGLALSTEAPTQANRSASPPKRGPTLFPAFLAASLAILSWTLATSPSSSQPDETRSDGELVEVWTSRLSGYAPKEIIQRLHKAVYTQPPEEVASNDPKVHAYPGGERHQYAMGWIRLDNEEALWASAKPELKLSELAAAAEDLPLRKSFRTDAAALERAIAAPSVPAADRALLYRRLLPLQMIDAYFEAWGQPGPYRVRPIQQAYAPTRLIKTPDIPDEKYSFESLGSAKRPDPIPVEQGKEPILDAGEFLLHHWAVNLKRAHPLILHDPRRLSLGQRQTVTGIQTMTLSFSDKTELRFGPRKIGVHLGEGPQRRFQRLRLRIGTGNILLPDALRIDWNEFRAFLRAAPGETNRVGYDFSNFPEFTQELDVPAEAWRAGENVLTIRLVTLPGLNPRQFANLFTVHLIAES